MGGYLGVLLQRRLARQNPAAAARLRGLLLIAPAADMTQALLWAEASGEARQAIMTRAHGSGRRPMASPIRSPAR
jgi:hypothetical protein